MKSCLFARPGELPRAGQGLLYSADGPTDGLLRSGVACVPHPGTWRNARQVPSSTVWTMDLPDKARAVSAVYALIGDGRVRTNAGRVMRLIEAVANGPPTSRIAVSER